MKDLGTLMRKAQEMQSKLSEIQAEIENQDVTGTSGAGLVSVTLTGKGDMKAIHFDNSIMNPDDREMLEDLILAAHNDAKKKADEMRSEKMGALTNGLPLPPGFKLPF